MLSNVMVKVKFAGIQESYLLIQNSKILQTNEGNTDRTHIVLNIKKGPQFCISFEFGRIGPLENV